MSSPFFSSLPLFRTPNFPFSLPPLHLLFFSQTWHSWVGQKMGMTAFTSNHGRPTMLYLYLRVCCILPQQFFQISKCALLPYPSFFSLLPTSPFSVLKPFSPLLNHPLMMADSPFFFFSSFSSPCGLVRSGLTVILKPKVVHMYTHSRRGGKAVAVYKSFPFFLLLHTCMVASDGGEKRVNAL